MDAAVPDNAFWTFSLKLYARPGVPPACLALQERRGIDVNIVLYCVWLGAERGVRIDTREAGEIVRGVSVWHDSVVRPLRAVRTRMKGETMGAPPVLHAALRTDIKRCELDAERIEQHLLFTQNFSDAPRATPSTFIARENVQAYLKCLGIQPDLNDESQVGRILGGLET